MKQNPSVFHQILNYIQKTQKSNQILSALQSKYYIFTYKLQSLDCQAIHKIYEGLRHRYSIFLEDRDRQNSWCQHERKIFIWQEQKQQEVMEEHWRSISSAFFNKSIQFLKFQYLNLMKLNGKICWAPEQDMLLLKAIQQNKQRSWYDISQKMFIQSNQKVFKSPKHCRQRFLNHLDDTKKRGDWNLLEDVTIFKYVLENGKRWCKIVPLLKSLRTQHMIKNRYNSIVCKYQKTKKERQEFIITKIIKVLEKQIRSIQRKKDHIKMTIEYEDHAEQVSIKYEPLPQVQPIPQEILQNKEVPIMMKQNIEEQDKHQGGYIFHEPLSVVAEVENKSSSDLQNNERSQTDITSHLQNVQQFYAYGHPNYMYSYQMHMSHVPAYHYSYAPVMPYYYHDSIIMNTFYS